MIGIRLQLTAMVAGALLLLSSCGLPSAVNPDDHAEVMAVVDEYLDLRVRSVVEGNTRALWKRFPRLKENRDPSAGINAEPELVEMYRSLKPYGGEIDPERVEPMRIAISSEGATVTIHGAESYQSLDYYGEESLSSAVFRLALYLKKRGRRWTLTRTDQVTLPELHERFH